MSNNELVDYGIRDILPDLRRFLEPQYSRSFATTRSLIEEAISEIESLRGELNSALCDTEKLDWLDRHADAVSYFRQSSDDWSCHLTYDDGQFTQSASLRDAIDYAAMPPDERGEK